jgi:hypothetical protein
MPPISDSDIDPVLLAESDPAMQIFQVATSTAASFISTSSTNLDDSNGNSDSDDFDMPPITEAAPGSSMTINGSGASSNAILHSHSTNVRDAARLAVLGRTIKDIKKLKSKSEADIDRYCSVRFTVPSF